MTKDLDRYWKDLLSMGMRYLQDQCKSEAANVIKRAVLQAEVINFDGFNGGITYWEIQLQLKYKDYARIDKTKDDLEEDIYEAVVYFHNDEHNPITKIIICPTIERYIDWNAALPITKEKTIQMIREEQKMLTDVATGQLLYKNEGVEEAFKLRHQMILKIANLTGFEYPVTVNSLAEWWTQIKEYGTHSDRRSYISHLFSELLDHLNDSDEEDGIDLQVMATRAGVIKKAIDDAEIFLRERRYDSAVDRVHTAFLGYLKQLLKEHGVAYEERETLSSLYTKLCSCYSESIDPPEVGERVKSILRSAGGMVTAINELRNNNSMAHANPLLIQSREAKMVIRLVKALVEYTEDLEASSVSQIETE